MSALTLTAEEAARRLDDNQYGEEGSPELFAAMKDAGLVAVFGASDDLVEFRGAIDDEAGAWEGTTVYLAPTGLLTNDCANDDCPHFAKLKQAAQGLAVVWGEGGYSWTYKTTIPHATFVIKEDDEDYCQGIVFALADVSRTAIASEGGAA